LHVAWPWQAEFWMSVSTANNFMRVCEKFRSNSTGVLNLEPSALYLLAAPSTPEPARQKVLAIGHVELERAGISVDRLGALTDGLHNVNWESAYDR
jgi:hypothetical protein